MAMTRLQQLSVFIALDYLLDGGVPTPDAFEQLHNSNAAGESELWKSTAARLKEGGATFETIAECLRGSVDDEVVTIVRAIGPTTRSGRCDFGAVVRYLSIAAQV
jgi:hypothetical protein